MQLLPLNENEVAEDIVDDVNAAVILEESRQRLLSEEVIMIQDCLRIVVHAIVVSIQVAPGVPLFWNLPF